MTGKGFIRMLRASVASFLILFLLAAAANSATLISSTNVIPVANGGGTSPNISTVGANLYIAALVDCTACTTTTITDNQGNTWARVPGTGQDCYLSSKVYLWYVINPITSATYNITIGGGNNFQMGGMEAFNTVITPVDQSQFTSNTCSTCNTVDQGTTRTPAGKNYLVVSGFCADSTAGTITVGGSFIATLAHDTIPSVAYGAGLAYWAQTTAMPANATWSTTNSITLGTDQEIYSGPQSLGFLLFHSFPP